MEYFVNVMKNVLSVLYQNAGASLVMAVLFMCVYTCAKRQGASSVVQGWIQEFRTDYFFRRMFLLVFYICMMLFRTLFCRVIWGNPLENVWGIWGLHKEDGSLYTENIENLILFVPFIFLLFWVLEKKANCKNLSCRQVAMKSIGVSLGFSLAIELCQLFLKIGTFQITDLFFNTLGGLAGGLLYWGVRHGTGHITSYVRNIGGRDEVTDDLLDEILGTVKPGEDGKTEPDREKECSCDSGSEKWCVDWITARQKTEIQSLIREAGKKMLTAELDEDSIHEKEGPANFCTDFDMEIQKFLIQGLGRIIPEAEFFGEEDTEGNAGASASGKYTFFIDPIDGTTNFMFSYNHSCVSVGLACDGEMKAGFVYNPYVDEMFAAVKGQGSFLNGRKLQIKNRSVKDGIAAFGCARYNDGATDLLFRTVKELFYRSLSIRCGGSAALDLCRIASGSNVIYLETKLQPYDYAAASVILEEAGGVIEQIDGSPVTLDRPCSVLAGTQLGCSEAREIIFGGKHEKADGSGKSLSGNFLQDR